MRVRADFAALGPHRTEVRIHQTYVPEAFLDSGAQAGFVSSLDRFAAYLARFGSLGPGVGTPGQEPA